MLKVLVTGANGFVGRELCSHLVATGLQVFGAVRQQAVFTKTAGVRYVYVADINATTDWTEALQGIDVVVHLAARVHVMQETAADPLAAFRSINVAGSCNLARQAAQLGIKRLVYMSSIKVLGESSGSEAFSDCSPVAPGDPYAWSKWEAEQELHKIALATDMELVVLRPPLIYGAGVQGNFLRLLGLIQRGIPLPLAQVHNKRTLLYVENCCSLIQRVIKHPAAAGQTLLLGDSEALATPQLLATLADASASRLWLLPVPVWLLTTLGRMVGKQSDIERLTGSMQVDITRTCALLNWQPPFTSQQGIVRTVHAYLAAH